MCSISQAYAFTHANFNMPKVVTPEICTLIAEFGRFHNEEKACHGLICFSYKSNFAEIRISNNILYRKGKVTQFNKAVNFA